jgi:L-lactate dehydrogenase complex protein LldG
LPDVAGWFAEHGRQEDTQQRTERLRMALEAVHTEIHDVTHLNWAEVLLQIVDSKGLRHVLIGADTPHGDELAACAPEALQIVRYDHPIESWQDQLFDGVDASLTLARGAVAETGSLILWPTPSEPRLMSLVPSLHFVLLDVGTIHADFYSAMTTEGWSSGMPTNALLICGPSKTADIQQTLAYGAHGPRELVVLLRQPQGASA